MAKKILKYGVGVDGHAVVIKGCFSRVCKIMTQDYFPRIWMEVDEENYDEVEVEIRCVGTGWEFSAKTPGQYIDSCIDGEGYVWHYYMDTPVFLSKEEKERAEQYMKYVDMINSLGNSNSIFANEPKIDLF